MTQVPVYAVLLQMGLGVGAAIFVAVIAFLQWRTAHEKVALDLFDRRFKVFMDVRHIVSKGGLRSKLGDEGLPNDVMCRGRFLFGNDVLVDLTKMHALVVRVDENDFAAAHELRILYDEMLPKFDRYMKMDAKPFNGR